MVLVAAPPHTTKLYSATSRSIRREPALHKSQAFSHLRANFNQIASARRVTRTRRYSLADHLSTAPSSAIDGSESSDGAREEALRRALEAALGSLGVLGDMYERREARWREEMQRVAEDREHVELLLRQALGPALAHRRDIDHLTPSS